MPLKLYDTMSRDVRDVFAMDENSVRFYACGPTVYGPAHVGNFRTFVMQDVFRRVWSELGLDEIDEYVKEIQREMGRALGQAGQGNFGPAWEFARQHRALVLGTLVPITLLVRSPALTAMSWRLLPFSVFLSRYVMPINMQWYLFSRLWIAAIKYVEKQITGSPPRKPGSGARF